jgi:hypothetical protein
MKRVEIEKKLHRYGVTLGDRIIVTSRFGRRGQSYEKAYTLGHFANNSLHLHNGGKSYIINFNEIENVEPANAN